MTDLDLGDGGRQTSGHLCHNPHSCTPQSTRSRVTEIHRRTLTGEGVAPVLSSQMGPLVPKAKHNVIFIFTKDQSLSLHPRVTPMVPVSREGARPPGGREHPARQGGVHTHKSAREECQRSRCWPEFGKTALLTRVGRTTNSSHLSEDRKSVV